MSTSGLNFTRAGDFTRLFESQDQRTSQNISEAVAQAEVWPGWLQQVNAGSLLVGNLIKSFT
eukprot:3847251-Rhodomonas_salina.1